MGEREDATVGIADGHGLRVGDKFTIDNLDAPEWIRGKVFKVVSGRRGNIGVRYDR